MARYYDSFPAYVPVHERQANARREASKLRKGGRQLAPVKIEGHKIATTFWGQAWCKHIETYSDYETRLPRGRSYARNGSVIDLQLEPGRVSALVSGSELYELSITIEPLALPRWKALVGQCAGKIDSVVELLTGQLSDSVMAQLCDPKTGLFPSARQLELSCSCPDSAGLCKHLAAAMYGVGARLDHQPELLFVLRGVDKLDLVSEAASGALAGSERTEAGELRRDDLAEIFGIELEPVDEAPAGRRRKGRKKR